MESALECQGQQAAGEVPVRKQPIRFVVMPYGKRPVEDVEIDTTGC